MYKENFDVQDILEIILSSLFAAELMLFILVANAGVNSMLTFELAIIVSITFSVIVGAIAFIIIKLTK